MTLADEVLRELRRAWPAGLDPAAIATISAGYPPTAAKDALGALVAAGAARLATSSDTVRVVLTESEAGALERRRAFTIHEGGRS